MRTYNRIVRRWAAIFMLVLFASLNAVDGISCPDGCTHTENGSSSLSTSSSDGVCLLCTGGVARPALEDVSPGLPVSASVVKSPAIGPTDGSTNPPERPPRS